MARLRKSLRLTQAEMADRLGVTRDKYKNWEYNTRPPQEVMRKAMAVKETSAPYRVSPPMTLPMSSVPVVGMASAGPGASDHHEYEIWAPSHMVTQFSTAWEAEGDSMMPWIQPGDVVIVQEHRTERINTPFLVRREDGSVSVKILRYRNGAWMLQSLNPKYEEEPASVELIGFVTGIYRVQGSRETMVCDLNGLSPENFF